MVLVGGAQIGVNRQAEDIPRQRLGYCQAGRSAGQVAVRRLLVERGGVVDGRRYPGRLEGTRRAVPIGDPHRVLRPGAHGTRVDDGTDDTAGQPLVVAPGDRIPGLELLREGIELHEEDGGLDRVQTGVETDVDVLVLVASL